MHARTRGVQRELADRDSHAAGTEIAQAEDALVVSGQDKPYARPCDVAEQLGNAPDVVRGDPQAARSTDDMAELPAGLAYRRRVHHRSQLLQMVEQHPVEEGLVAILQRGQPDVLLKIVALTPQMLELESNLF